MNNFTNTELILTNQNFSEEVLESNQPVLVDFWAAGCIPCQMVTPIIKDIANEFDGKIKVGKLNIDQNPSIATTFEIEAIPTLILFHNKKIFQKFIGVQPKKLIIEAINLTLTNKN
ncbi:thioredoxin [Candidatus Babeliales bacterium]|nr:thioredoxin [Candidatus Babeliales bacterium]